MAQLSSRVQREQEEVQRRAGQVGDTALKQEAEAQRLQLEKRAWQEGEAERLRLDAAARESKQQANHLKVCVSPRLWSHLPVDTMLLLQTKEGSPTTKRLAPLCNDISKLEACSSTGCWHLSC